MGTTLGSTSAATGCVMCSRKVKRWSCSPREGSHRGGGGGLRTRSRVVRSWRAVAAAMRDDGPQKSGTMSVDEREEGKMYPGFRDNEAKPTPLTLSGADGLPQMTGSDAGAVVSLALGGTSLLAALFAAGMALENREFGNGDLLAAALWGGSLWFTTPLQILLLFLGKIDTQRPSDAALLTVAEVNGRSISPEGGGPPVQLVAGVAMGCASTGLGVAAAGSWLFFDPTWAISTGIGMVMMTVVYEIGRPQRLEGQDAVDEDIRFSCFEAFADESLRLGSGLRCHRSEIVTAFRRSSHGVKYRTTEGCSDAAILRCLQRWREGGEPSGSRRFRSKKSGFLEGVGIQAGRQY